MIGAVRWPPEVALTKRSCCLSLMGQQVTVRRLALLGCQWSNAQPDGMPSWCVSLDCRAWGTGIRKRGHPWARQARIGFHFIKLTCWPLTWHIDMSPIGPLHRLLHAHFYYCLFQRFLGMKDLWHFVCNAIEILYRKFLMARRFELAFLPKKAGMLAVLPMSTRYKLLTTST